MVSRDLRENRAYQGRERLGHRVHRGLLDLQEQTVQTVCQGLVDLLGPLVFPDLLGERPDRVARRERQERLERTGRMARMVMMGRRALPVHKAHRDRKVVLPQPRVTRRMSSALRASRSSRSRYTSEPLSTRT